MLTLRQLAAVAALVLALPLASRAKPVGEFRYVVSGPGDQTSPSIDGNHVVYAGPAADRANGTDIFLYDFLSPGALPLVLGGGPGDQDSPDVFGTVVAFRDPGGIWLRNWGSDQMLRTGGDAPEAVSAPSVGAYVAAWERGAPGARDIVVDRFNVGDEYVLPPSSSAQLPGDRHGPATRDTLVAYIDESDGASVQIHDSNPSSRGTRLLCPGRATGVALGEYQSRLVAAVARVADGNDEDVEVRDLDAQLAVLHVAGEQRNPHVSADWVAFEDLSTGRSQVVLWQWTTGLVFVPHPSDSQQRLNDLYAGDGIVRVVFADDAAGNLDIALYQLTVSPSIPDDGTPSNWPPARTEPATCDPGGGAVLATLSLGRDGQRPEAAEAAFAADAAAGSLPVLLCIDATRVSAAWIALDDEAVANPSQFNPGVVHLEVRSAVDGGKGRIAGVIAGMPGAALDVRVIADPARVSSSSGPALRALPAAAGAASGCGIGGGGLGCLLAVALAFLRRRS